MITPPETVRVGGNVGFLRQRFRRVASSKNNKVGQEDAISRIRRSVFQADARCWPRQRVSSRVRKWRQPLPAQMSSLQGTADAIRELTSRARRAAIRMEEL